MNSAEFHCNHIIVRLDSLDIIPICSRTLVDASRQIPHNIRKFRENFFVRGYGGEGDLSTCIAG